MRKIFLFTVLPLLVSTSAFAESDAYQGLFNPQASSPTSAASTTDSPVSAPMVVAPSQVPVAPSNQIATTAPATQPAPPTNTAPSAPTTLSQTTPNTTWSAPDGSPTVGNALWGGGGATVSGRLLPTGASDGYCDPEIAKLDEKLRAQEIDGRTSLARQTYSILPAGFSSLSCIDRLLNSSINIFGPGGLQGIISQVLNSFSCERVLRTVNSYANQQISQYASQGVGMVTSAIGSLPIGNAIPGVSLSSMTSGAINLRPTVDVGGAGSNYVNLGQAWNNGSSGAGPRLPSRLFGQ